MILKGRLQEAVVIFPDVAGGMWFSGAVYFSSLFRVVVT